MRFLTRRLGQMTRGGILGMLAVFALGGLVLFVLAARTLNSTPQQCATCHPDLTAMWQRSQGHPSGEVTCYQCHAQHAELPGSMSLYAFVRDELIPEKYLSTDERVEARCEGCHEMRDKEKETRKIVKVNHKVHLVTGKDDRGRPLEMSCLDCHRTLAHDRSRVETNRPSMTGCFAGACHQKDRNKDNCKRCHYQHLAESDQTLL